jgi:hypothetical protein
MSKVTAYICDNCGTLYRNAQGTEIKGIEAKDNMFDKLAGYAAIAPENTDIHHCTACYRAFVIEPAERQAPRKYRETQYILKLKELYFSLRQTTYLKYSQRKK